VCGCSWSTIADCRPRAGRADARPWLAMQIGAKNRRVESQTLSAAQQPGLACGRVSSRAVKLLARRYPRPRLRSAEVTGGLSSEAPAVASGLF